MSEESEFNDGQDRWDLLAKDLLGGEEGLDEVVDLENLEEEELSTQFPLPRNDRDELSDSNPDMEESLDDEEDESIELMLGSDVDLDQIIDPDSEETIQNSFGMGIDLDDSSKGPSDAGERTTKKSSRSRRRRSAPESEDVVAFEEAATSSEEVIGDPVESTEAVDHNAFGMGIDLDDSSKGPSDAGERTTKKSSRSRRRRSAPESEDVVAFEEAATSSEEVIGDPVESTEAVDHNAFGMGIDLDDSSKGPSDTGERTTKKSSRSRRSRRRRSAPESEDVVAFEEVATPSEEGGRDSVESQSSSNKKADKIPSWSDAIACLKRSSSNSNSRNSNSNRRRSRGSSRQSS